MIVTEMPVESLVPYARNPRNNTSAIDAVKASIAEFGFRQPIVVDEKLVVIVGHTRLEAAKALGLKMVPVHVAEGLTPAQARTSRLVVLQVHALLPFPREIALRTVSGNRAPAQRRQRCALAAVLTC